MNGRLTAVSKIAPVPDPGRLGPQVGWFHARLINARVLRGATLTTTTYDPNHPSYFDEGDLRAELERVYDLCHGCRLCFNLCPSFPTLFDLIDGHDGVVSDLSAPESGTGWSTSATSASSAHSSAPTWRRTTGISTSPG